MLFVKYNNLHLYLCIFKSTDIYIESIVVLLALRGES